MNLRDLILDADDRQPEAVHVPEWKVTLYVRPLTGLELLKFEEWAEASRADNTTKMARLVVLCAVDDQGQPVFQEGDEAALTKKAGAALLKVSLVAAKLNGMTKDAMESLLGNSANGRSVASPTA